jgi:hypothetical protein
MAGRFDPLLDGNREQRPSETEFVAIGVNYVEEALTPFGIVRHGSWLVSRCERMVVKCVRSAGRDSSVCRRFMPVSSWTNRARSPSTR